MSSSSTSSIVSQCGAIVWRETARGDEGRLLAERLATGAGRSRRPGRRSRRRSRPGSRACVCLPIGPSGAERSIRGSFAVRAVSASSEISTPGPDHAAEVLARAGDDVEVGRGAEVDRHAGALHLRVGGDRVDEPVGAELVRVVDQDRHPGLHARADQQARLSHVPLGRAARTRARAAGTTVETIAPSSEPKLSPVQREQVRDRRCELVRGGARDGAEAPVARQLLAPRRRRGASAYCRRRPRAASAGLSRPQ